MAERDGPSTLTGQHLSIYSVRQIPSLHSPCMCSYIYISPAYHTLLTHLSLHLTMLGYNCQVILIMLLPIFLHLQLSYPPTPGTVNL